MPAKRKQTKVDRSAERKARFERLAPKRMNRTLRALNGIRNLAGPGYSYTEAQAAKIVNDLRSAVNSIQSAFAGEGKQATQEWSL